MPLWGISVFPQKYIFTNGWAIYGTYWAYYGLLGTYTVPVEQVRGAWGGQKGFCSSLQILADMLTLFQPGGVD